MNKSVVFLFSALFLSCSAYARDEHTAPAKPFPDLIPVQNGLQPEGVVRGEGSMAYVGSLLSESIYKVDLRTGKGALFVDKASANPILGIAYDKRTNSLFTAGGPSGAVSVFNAENGDKLAQFDVAGPGSLINDGVVTENAAYFTDSFAPVIYRIPLGKKGQLPDHDAVETVALTGDFQFVPGTFNGNGITQSKNKKHLILVNSATGKLYNVDGKTGVTAEIVINNGNVVSGDGLLLKDDKLYVAQNFLNQVTELDVSDDGKSAMITRIITDPNFHIPTTLTAFGDGLYAINAHFDIAPPPFFGTPASDSSLKYELVRIKIDN